VPSKSATGQDTQYAAKEFRKELDAADFAQSFSVKRHPFDNMHRQEGRPPKVTFAQQKC